MYAKRGNQLSRLIGISIETKTATVLIEEQSVTFIDYGKVDGDQLKEGKELLWMSERSGWNHLYVFDGVKGGLKRALTDGEWVVRSIERIDEETGLIWFWPEEFMIIKIHITYILERPKLMEVVGK